MADKVTVDAKSLKVAEPVITVLATPKTKVVNTVVSTVVGTPVQTSIAPTAPATVAAVTARVAPGGDTVQPAAIGKAKYN